MSDQMIMFIHALTGLHPGGGTALGVIDLPIQRERHTNWPTIPDSSLKGVLRHAFRRYSSQNTDIPSEEFALFGPDVSSDNDHSGALSLSDARILAFPVRSLSGVFAWITCPDVLHRFTRDLSIVDKESVSDIPQPDKDQAYSVKESPLISKGKMILEEFEFDVSFQNNNLAHWIAPQVTNDEPTQERIKNHLVILNNDDFTHFVVNATEVIARIGLDYKTKTVRKSALFYEEYLPAETLLYSLVICQNSFSDYQASGTELLEALQSKLLSYVQIGGGETVGKGICGIKFSK